MPMPAARASARRREGGPARRRAGSSPALAGSDAGEDVHQRRLAGAVGAAAAWTSPARRRSPPASSASTSGEPAGQPRASREQRHRAAAYLRQQLGRQVAGQPVVGPLRLGELRRLGRVEIAGRHDDRARHRLAVQDLRPPASPPRARPEAAVTAPPLLFLGDPLDPAVVLVARRDTSARQAGRPPRTPRRRRSTSGRRARTRRRSSGSAAAGSR